MECVVRLAKCVMNGKGAVFSGISRDPSGDVWSVRARLGEQVGDDPYLWTATVWFLCPEAEERLGSEFEITNGLRCLAKVIKRAIGE